MNGTLTEDRKIVVFISYSRDDSQADAKQLRAALVSTGFEPTLDQINIPGGDAWKNTLTQLISHADAVVFVLSPKSIASEWCKWEVDEAVRLGKRIIPVLCQSIGEAKPLITLADLNYIYFYHDEKTSDSGFGTGVAKLITALNEDPGWWREHTRLLARASYWEAAGRATGDLLSSDEVVAAKAWLLERRKSKSMPTALHIAYIEASEQYGNAMLDKARRDLEERERLLADKEDAQKREAEAMAAREQVTRRLVRNTRAWLAVAVVLLGITVGLGLLAHRQNRESEKQNETLSLRESLYLADRAKQETEKHDATVGVLLALEGLPDPASDDLIARNRKYLSQVEVSLEAARREARELKVLAGHSDGLTGVAMSADGTRIFTSSFDNTLKAWDATGKELVQLARFGDTFASVAATPDGRHIVAAGQDNAAYVWTLPAGPITFVSDPKKLRYDPGQVQSVAITPDGSRVVTGSKDEAAVWDVARTRSLVTLKGRHKGMINGVAITANGATVVTGGGDGQVLVWDTGSGEVQTELTKVGGKINAVAVTPDGLRAVTGGEDKLAYVYDIASPHEIAKLEGHKGEVKSVAITADGRTVVTASDDNSVRVWDVASARELFQFKGHSDEVSAIALSPDGSRIVSASSDRTARIWDASARRGPDVMAGHGGKVVNAVAISGSRIVSGGADGTARVWDINSGLETIAPIRHGSAINAVAIAGDRAVSAGDDTVARIWSIETGNELARLKGHADAITSVAFSTDGKRAVTGSNDKTARIWDPATGQELFKLEPQPGAVTSVAIHGDTVFTGSDGSAKRWNLSTGQLIDEYNAHPDDIASLAVLPDGQQFVTGSKDGTARLWHAGEPKVPTATFKDHTNGVSGISITEDGKRLVIGTNEYFVRVWTPEGELTAEISNGDRNGGSKVRSVAVAASGHLFVTGSEDGKIRVSRLFSTGHDLINEARRDVSRCLTPVERIKFNLQPVAPAWCDIDRKWPYDGIGAMIEGSWLIADARDQEAETHFGALLSRNPALLKDVALAKGRGHVTRGGRLLDKKRIEAAQAEFELAMSFDNRTTREIVDAWLGRGSNLASGRDNKMEATVTENHERAISYYDGALKWARRGNLESMDQADIHVYRAASLDALGRTSEALAELAEARTHGNAKTLERIIDLGEQVAREPGGELRSFLIKWTTLLDAVNLTRKTDLNLNEFNARIAIWTGITALYGKLSQGDAGEASDCDLMAGSKADPYRAGNGIDFDDIDALAAIEACDKMIREHPGEPRYRYQRARASTRASRQSAAANDDQTARDQARLAIDDLEVAMRKGYPMAFNQMGNALREGEGVTKNEAKSIEIKRATFNRMLHCCWAKAGRALLADAKAASAGRYDIQEVQRVIRQVTAWSAALGSKESRVLLDELMDSEAPGSTASVAPASFDDLPPWIHQSQSAAKTGP